MKANIDFVLPRLATGGDLHIGVGDDGGQMPHDWYQFGTGWIKDNEQTGPAHRIRYQQSYERGQTMGVEEATELLLG